MTAIRDLCITVNGCILLSFGLWTPWQDPELWANPFTYLAALAAGCAMAALAGIFHHMWKEKR